MTVVLFYKTELPIQLAKAEKAVVIPEHGICNVSLVKILAYYKLYLVDFSVKFVILYESNGYHKIDNSNVISVG